MDWWTDAETFHASPFANNWGENGQFDWGTLAQAKFTFTTHCPIDKNFIDRCHQMGVRCFPYVSFFFGADHLQFGPISSNTYEGVDYSQHPDFIERDQQQNPKSWPFGAVTDGVGVSPSSPFLVCPNYEPFQQKMVDWVDYIMQQGADGIYVDNLLFRRHCFAPHQHIYPDNPSDPDAAQNQAFELLLSRVRKVVKSYKPEGLVIGNSGDPLGLLPNQSSPGFQQYLDADTLESYICSGPRTLKWQNLIDWDGFGQKLQAYLAQGKQILAISALVDPLPDPGQTVSLPFREDAFLCYCAARLAGLTWYGGPMNRAEVADLHRIRLGKPLGAEVTDAASQFSYRVFEHGIVAVNWNQSSAKSFPGQAIAGAALATKLQNVQFFYDQFASPDNTTIDTGATSGLLQVPAYSGRVFLFGSSTDYGLNRVSADPKPHPVPHPGPHPGQPPIHPPSGPPHVMS
jgi:hypothetical protein